MKVLLLFDSDLLEIKYPITATKQLPGIHKALTKAVSRISTLMYYLIFYIKYLKF